ncbi:hypothetical protein D3C80_1348270 [compost metagenome]
MAKRSQYRHRVSTCRHLPQIITIARHARIQKCLIVLRFRQRVPRNVTEIAAQRPCCLLAIPGIYRKGQLTNARVGIKAIALAQQAQAVAHGCLRLGTLPLQQTTRQPRELFCPCHAITLLGKAADIAQHRASLNRSQLIAIAQENHPRLSRQSGNQARHHRQVNHRGFIDHQYIQMQRVATVITHTLAVGLSA